MTINEYNNSLNIEDRAICEQLRSVIDNNLTSSESKVWHGHPVWFIGDNPIVGYSKQKAGVRLMFWSGADFDEPQLLPGTGKFKDASIFYNYSKQIDIANLIQWLKKSQTIQWDYKNIIKNKGLLKRNIEK